MSTIRESFAGKHILVTGVTGFLGKVWLAMVLDRLPEVRKLTVVARGQKGKTAAQRFEQIYECSPAFRPLRDKHGTGLRALIADKVAVLDAPLTKPLCGMDRASAQKLMRDVDLVMHFAGLVDFEPDPRMSIDANIHGAMNVAQLASLSPSKRYVHCSTCFVAGMKDGEVPETVTPGISPNGTRFDPKAELAAFEAEIDALSSRTARVDRAMARAKVLGWPNIYTYTKGLAEHLVEATIDVRGTTVRPAIVECAQSFPFTGWNEGVNTSAPLVWLLSTHFRRFPARPTNIFDVIPVDMVARAAVLACAASFENRAKSVYQVGSGHQNPLRFERAIELTNLANRKKHKASDNWTERNVLRFLEAYTVNPDRAQILDVAELKRLAGEARQLVRKFDVKEWLPPRLSEKHGDDLDAEVRSLGTELRSTERQLQSVVEMLKQFRPFIHDFDYVFRTDHLVEETARLSAEDRAEFGFNVSEIDWRRYWIDVQVPGLETWSIPVLRGDKVYDDPPLPRDDKPTVAHEMQVVGITVQA